MVAKNYKDSFLFEKKVNLCKYYDIIKVNRNPIKFDVLIFKKRFLFFKRFEKSWFRKYMLQQKLTDLRIKPAHGCKQPDEVFISGVTIYIIEKKFQTVAGSTAEKLQTGFFKLEHYKKLYPRHRVFYIYLLSEWFRDNCRVEITYLLANNISVFWVSDKTWELKLIKLLHG